MRARLIAELGQNHNGSVDIALAMVDMVAEPFDPETGEPVRWKWDAVKTTKRDLEYELTGSGNAAPYEGRHSFGPTYGEHRAALELSWPDHARINEYVTSKGLDHIITLCAPGLVDECPFTPAAYKVASRDLTNGPLLESLAGTDVPVILSTGMHGPDELADALAVLGTDRTTVLHCVSAYPTRPRDVNLHTITWLRERHPDVPVGFSDHTVGLLAAPLAVSLGATVIEKHVTLYRGLRGTDQAGAVGPDGAWRYVRNVRQAERMFGVPEMFASPATNAARRKLERSMAAENYLPPGTVLGSSNTTWLSPGTGIPWKARGAVYGKTLRAGVAARELIPYDAVA